MRFLTMMISVTALVLLIFSSLSAVSYSSSVGDTKAPGPTPEYSGWQQEVTSLPPTSVGCFEASYPSVTWIAGSQCVTPPSIPLTVGNGNDWEDQIASGNHIGQADGYISSMSGYSSESDSFAGTNYYTIQDNSNFFSTSYAGNPTTGWEQFIFQNDPGASAGYVYIQYWLINYFSTYGSCPSTHAYLTSWSQYGSDCWANSNVAFKTAQENPSGLASYSQKGYANNGGNDESVFCYTTSCYATAVPYTILNLASGWTVSEWNVLGYGGGSDACFNAAGNPCPAPSGSPSLTITQYLYNSAGTNVGSNCNVGGTTGETNNLNLPNTCYTVSSTSANYFYFTMT